jgi:hypothetical protein
MVKKKDGTWQACGDFWSLNLVMEPDCYLLPNMLDFSERLRSYTIFSKIDLCKGYWQVPVNPADIKKTAVSTPFGLFEVLRLPFGLRNEGNNFQRMMDQVLGCLPFTYVYQDDLRVASRDWNENLLYLQLVFDHLRLFGLVINQRSASLECHRLSSWTILSQQGEPSRSPATWRRWKRLRPQPP